MLDATVAVPMRNAAATIAEQLDALAAQDFEGEWEVLVADNGSTDASARIVRRYVDRLPHLRVIDARGRPGVAAARNAALAEARGAVFALCDADDVVDQGWLRALHAAASAWDVVGGCIDDDTLNSTRVRRLRGREGRSTALPVVAGFLPYATGCNLACRTEVGRTLGGWDESYVAGMDDVEFSWRAQLAGYSLGYAPDAIVCRRHRTSLLEIARQLHRYERNTSRLQQDFAARGLVARSGGAVLRQWAWLVARAYLVLGPEDRRAQWVRAAAKESGRVTGAAQLRLRRLRPGPRRAAATSTR